MVKSVSKEGYIRFLPIGGWHPPVVLGQRVVIQTQGGPVLGIVGAKPPHEMKDEEKKKMVELDEQWIDVGVCKDQFNPAEQLKIRPGDPIVPYGEFCRSSNPKIYIARNWDNRSGCVAAVRIFQQLKDSIPECSVYGVFSVQEEIGLRGAATAAWMVDPDVAFALDVSLGEDTPAAKNESEAKLGAGPSILVYDRTMIPHLKLRDTVVHLAEERKIPFHYTSLTGGYDTGKVHMHKRGVPSCVLGIPSRYIHGFASMIHEDDLENTVKLSCAFIESTTPNMLDDIKKFD